MNRLVNKLIHCTQLVFILLTVFCQQACENGISQHIDRQALVKRHIPVLTTIDSLSPFTLGNGEFAFTTDITGLGRPMATPI